MAELYTFGAWKPSAGKEQAFIDAWLEFAGWASGRPGAGKVALHATCAIRSLHQLRELGHTRRRARLEELAEFRERISRIKQHVDEFEPTELTVVATAESGAGAVEPLPLQIEPIHAP